LLYDQWVIKKIREEIKTFLEFNENESTTYQNLWDPAKTALRGKLIAMNVYIKKRKISNKQPNAAYQTPRKTSETQLVEGEK
jgi:hypothetical protein